MKNVLLSLAAITICVVIGSAMGNQGGGFITGVVLAIMLSKRNWKFGTKKSTEVH